MRRLIWGKPGTLEIRGRNQQYGIHETWYHPRWSSPNPVIEVQLVTDTTRSGKLGLAVFLARRAFQLQGSLGKFRSVSLSSQQSTQSFRARMS